MFSYMVIIEPLDQLAKIAKNGICIINHHHTHTYTRGYDEWGGAFGEGGNE